MPGYVWDYYATSVKMSTYLVCMLVSEFIAVPSDPGAGRIPFRIMARPDARNLTEWGILLVVSFKKKPSYMEVEKKQQH